MGAADPEGPRWSYLRLRFTRLVRPRSLQSFSDDRGLVVVPKGRPFVPTSDVVHRHSVLVFLPIPDSFGVIEWTDGEPELHTVDW